IERQRRAWRQLERLDVDGARPRDVGTPEEHAQGASVDRASEARVGAEGFQLRREYEMTAGMPVVQGLLPEPVPHEVQPRRMRVPETERPHAVGLVERLLETPAGDVGEQDFSVRGAAESGPAPLQRPAQLSVVVDLAVERDGVAAAGVLHRLVTLAR